LIWLAVAVVAVVIAYPYFNTAEQNSEQQDNLPVTAVSDTVSVHYIDVGQGDSIFINSESGNMLIDCGEAGETEKVIKYISDMGITKLDYVIGTHAHSDHMGGMYKIVNAFEIGEFIIPHIDDSDTPTTQYFSKFLDSIKERKVKLTESQTGRIISLGSAKCRFIAPVSEDYSNMNNYSVGIIMNHGNNSFIFTGDAETLAEKEMIDSNELQDIDVYKVGHHGSDTSSSPEFLEVIKPDYAVISCGEGNSYGHPCDITLEKLTEYTDKIYRTDLSGTIVFRSDGNNYDIQTERGN